MLSTFVLSAILSFGCIGQTVEVEVPQPPAQPIQPVQVLTPVQTVQVSQTIEPPQIITDTYLQFESARLRGDRTEMISLANKMVGLLACHSQYREWLKANYPNDLYVLLHLRDQIPQDVVVVYSSAYPSYSFYHYPIYSCYSSNRYVFGAVSRVLHRAPVCHTVEQYRPCPPRAVVTHCPPVIRKVPCQPVRVSPPCPRPVSRPQSAPRPQTVVHAAPRPAPAPRVQPAPTPRPQPSPASRSQPAPSRTIQTDHRKK